ncbi:PREDICTED: ejaculatory bulb-specific protein 3-like [Ceratosolen solmsi marchali]|uniref:Ejaculatory bulb-specific protein 3-like n=1 Tax=Ceratosolen solmsi marchali TaxID=326594 RepID=A0AAJ6YR37_9HYME|nr:PREDICTED: ejaculatory bulb-specific protein 3-like [Ceratosolen solmsi marchali]
MKDKRAPFYLSLILVGWAIAVVAEDPFLRINSLLQDEASVQYYANCLLDKGPCSGDGRAMKRLLPEFITTSCARCSERYKKIGCEVILTMQQAKYDNLWKEFLLKYDPQNLYQTNLQNFMQYCRENIK